MTKIPLLEKLAAQSLVYVDAGLDDGPELIFSKERFAELIVRECCDIFVELRTRPADLAVKDVKKHFGVEE